MRNLKLHSQVPITVALELENVVTKLKKILLCTFWALSLVLIRCNDVKMAKRCWKCKSPPISDHNFVQYAIEHEIFDVPVIFADLTDS